MMASVDINATGSSSRPNLRLRRQSGHLPPLHITNDNHGNMFYLSPKVPTVEETREEGKALFGQFIEEEINRDGEVETPDVILNELHQLTPQDYANPAWARAGQDLRRYADDFMKSKERKKVKQRAYMLLGEDTTDGCITEGQFRDLLCELLSDGITRERIIVLFVFCADVAIATLKRKAQTLCQQFIQWSTQFISDYVCNWVQDNGGWGAVLGLKWKYLKHAAIVIGFGAVVYYSIKKVLHWNKM
ncbi:hypothetical protein ACF0H5_013084 [Mactra antiquata]